MNCEDLQFNLSLYSDGELPSEDEKTLQEHLKICPLCRIKQTDFVALQNDLRNFATIEMPPDLQFAVRSAVAKKIQTQPLTVFSPLDENLRHFLQFKVFPYAAGTLTSVTLAILVLLSLSTFPENLEKTQLASNKNATTMIAANAPSIEPLSFPNQEIGIREKEYAALRQPFSSESPSFNPNGTFLQLTEKLSRKNLNDGEITFVADVFSNGLAQISEVVNAPRTKKSLEEIERALHDDPAYAPFVPAKFDNRSDVIRIVVKIQHVEVTDIAPAKKLK